MLTTPPTDTPTLPMSTEDTGTPIPSPMPGTTTPMPMPLTDTSVILARGLLMLSPPLMLMLIPTTTDTHMPTGPTDTDTTGNPLESNNYTITAKAQWQPAFLFVFSLADVQCP